MPQADFIPEGKKVFFFLYREQNLGKGLLGLSLTPSIGGAWESPDFLGSYTTPDVQQGSSAPSSNGRWCRRLNRQVANSHISAWCTPASAWQ